MGLLQPHAGHRPGHARGALTGALIHGLADVRRALAQASGAPVRLCSAPGAGAYLGPALFKAIMDRARAEFPKASVTFTLDCADEPATALAALALGIDRVAVDVPPPVLDKLRAAARGTGCRVVKGSARG